jgi:Na+/glutamate symporter
MKKDLGSALAIAFFGFLLGVMIGWIIAAKIEQAYIKQITEKPMEIFQVGDLTIGLSLSEEVEKKYKAATVNLVEKFTHEAGRALAAAEVYDQVERIEILTQRILGNVETEKRLIRMIEEQPRLSNKD